MIPCLRRMMQIGGLGPGHERQKDRSDIGRSRNRRIRDEVTEETVMTVGALAPTDFIHAHSHQGNPGFGRIRAIRRHHGRRYSTSHDQEKHSGNAGQSMAQPIGYAV